MDLQKKIKKARELGYSDEEINQYIKQRAPAVADMGISNTSAEPQWSDLPGNIIPSAKNNLKSILDVFTNPVQTGLNIGGTIAGGVSKALPGYQPEEEYINNLMSFYKDRYGGLQNVKKTLIEDPTGALFDASTLLTGAGTAVKGAGAVSKIGALEKFGQGMQTVGRTIDPLEQATRIASPVTKPVTQAIDDIPGEIVNRYIPPDVRQSRISEVDKLLTKNEPRMGSKIAKETNIPFTPEGLVKLSEKNIQKLGPEIRQTIDANADIQIPGTRILQKIEELDNMFGGSLEGGQVPEEINRIGTKLLDAMDESGNITASKLYDIKSKQDKITGKFYEKGKAPNQVDPNLQVRIEVSNTIRDLLNEMVPGLEEVNSKYNLWKRAKGAALPIAEKGMNFKLSQADLFFGGTGAAVGGIPGALGGIALRRAVTSPTTGLTTARGVQIATKGAKALKVPLETTALLNYLFGRAQEQSNTVEN